MVRNIFQSFVIHSLPPPKRVVCARARNIRPLIVAYDWHTVSQCTFITLSLVSAIQCPDLDWYRFSGHIWRNANQMWRFLQYFDVNWIELNLLNYSPCSLWCDWSQWVCSDMAFRGFDSGE
jgi:hypothetical protein